MGAFDFGDVEEAGGVADQGAAWESAFRDGLEAAFVEGAGGVGDAFAVFEDGGVEGVVFHFLEFLVGGEPGVGVIEADDEAEGDEVVAEVVEPAAAVGVGGEGVAQRVEDVAGFELRGGDFPDFFDAEAVGLGLGVSAEVVLFDDLFCEGAVAAFGEEGDAGVKLHAALEGGFGLAGAGYPKVVGGDALNAVV